MELTEERIATFKGPGDRPVNIIEGHRSVGGEDAHLCQSAWRGGTPQCGYGMGCVH